MQYFQALHQTPSLLFVHTDTSHNRRVIERWYDPELNQVESTALDLCCFILLERYRRKLIFTPLCEGTVASSACVRRFSDLKGLREFFNTDVLNKIRVSLFIRRITHDCTDHLVSCIHFIGRIWTQLCKPRCENAQLIPLPLHCTVRLISFIRVIGGLEGSQWRERIQYGRAELPWQFN